MGCNKAFLQKGIFYLSYTPSLSLYAMITNHIIESFLECPYKAYLLFHDEQGKPTEYERLGKDLLGMHRTDFYAQLCTKYDESQLLQGVTFEKKLAITDTTYVLEPVFQSEEVRISFDALEIAPHKELPSKLMYLPIEVIPKERVSKTDKLALALKCLLLTQAQRRVMPEFGKIVYGRALTSTKVKLAVYAKEARKILKDLRKTLQSDKPPRFFQIDKCRICEFQEDCKTRLIEKDDLSLLAGMRPKEVLKQNNRGIFNVLQFSYTFRPRRRSKKAADKPLRFEPALKALALREKKTYIQELPKLPETGVEVYLDFEGLPDEKFIYLIGLIIKHGDTERQFSFWADIKEDEEAIFARLLETLAPFENFTIYHYGSYEAQALKRLNRKFDNRYEEEIKWMLEKPVNILSFFS
jgi:predicted RecB family nuclease